MQSVVSVSVLLVYIVLLRMCLYLLSCIFILPAGGAAGLCHRPVELAGLCHRPVELAGLCHRPVELAGLCHRPVELAGLCHRPVKLPSPSSSVLPSPSPVLPSPSLSPPLYLPCPPLSLSLPPSLPVPLPNGTGGQCPAHMPEICPQTPWLSIEIGKE